jgi:predicted small secreted protein
MKLKSIILIVLAASILVVSCKDDDNEPQGIVQDTTPYEMSIGGFPIPNIASDNQLTVQGVKLGRMLFYE